MLAKISFFFVLSLHLNTSPSLAPMNQQPPQGGPAESVRAEAVAKMQGVVNTMLEGLSSVASVHSLVDSRARPGPDSSHTRSGQFRCFGRGRAVVVRFCMCRWLVRLFRVRERVPQAAVASISAASTQWWAPQSSSYHTGKESFGQYRRPRRTARCRLAVLWHARKNVANRRPRS